MERSLRLNTRRTYNSAQKRYLEFCHTYKLIPLPANEQVLLLYVAFLYTQGLTHSTVQVYLAAVRSLHVFQGYGNPLEACLRLKQVVKAVHIESAPVNQKLPITFDIMSKLQTVVSNFSDGTMLWCAMLLAFFGCMRASEFTVNAAFDKSIHICVSDVSLIDSHIPHAIVFVKKSKTDIYNKGVSLYIGCTSNPILCAHCSLRQVVVGRSSESPLFMFTNGSPLSKYVFVRATRLALSLLGYPSHQYSGHSFRAGAATTAASVGMSGHEIQLLGRWRSNAYVRYIRSPINLLCSFAPRLSKSQHY